MVVDKSISRRKPYCTIKRNPFDDPQFQRRLHLHRRIFDSSPARDIITSGITIWKTFHPPPVSQNRAMEAVEKSERGKLANRRERVVEQVGSRERPSTARCREICRDLHGRLASLAPREQTSESPLSPFSFSSIIPWSTGIPAPLSWSCHPLTPARAGVACRIKKAFGESRCLPERCKIEIVWDSSPHFSLSFKFIHRSFFFFFSTYSIDDIRFPGSSIAFRYLSIYQSICGYIFFYNSKLIHNLIKLKKTSLNFY